MSNSLRKRKPSIESLTHSLGDQSSDIMLDEIPYAPEAEYNVEKILDMKEEKGTTFYLVKWEGYPESESTWEPIDHLQNVLDMVEEFEIELTKRDSLKEQRFPQRNSNFGEIERIRENMESQEYRGLFEDDEAFKKRRNEERKGEDREIRQRILGESELELFQVKDKGLELSSGKNDREKNREKRREKGSQLMQEAKQRKEKENSERKVGFKDELLTNGDAVSMRKMELEDSKSAVTAQKMMLERSAGKNGVKDEKNTEEKKNGRSKGNKENSKVGSFKSRDKPKQILTIKEKKKGGFWFLIEWQRREDGTKPENSYVGNEELKENDPYFLISFYESKVIVLPKNKKNQKLNMDEIKSLVDERNKSASKVSVDMTHDLEDEDDEIYASGRKSNKVYVTDSGMKKRDKL